MNRVILLLVGLMFWASESQANPLHILEQERTRLQVLVGQPILNVPDTVMRKGSTGFDVLVLSKRLSQIYPAFTERSVFDEEMDIIVRQYQQDNKIGVDGIVGPNTRAALNISYADRLRAVERSIIEVGRIRWSGKDIVVNIPSMSIIAYENKQPVLHSRAIVGHPKRQTPMITSRAFSIKYNPDWTVPPGITRRYRAKLAAEGDEYFRRNNIQIRYQNGQAHFWQPPSESSALGLLKFELDNNQNIYLHDTNERRLFVRDDRAQSSGCVRVERYTELASWLLGKSEGHIRNRIQTGKMHWEKVDRPAVTHMIYATAWPNEHGVVTYHNDIYSRY